MHIWDVLGWGREGEVNNAPSIIRLYHDGRAGARLILFSRAKGLWSYIIYILRLFDHVPSVRYILREMKNPIIKILTIDTRNIRRQLDESVENVSRPERRAIKWHKTREYANAEAFWIPPDVERRINRHIAVYFYSDFIGFSSRDAKIFERERETVICELMAGCFVFPF